VGWESKSGRLVPVGVFCLVFLSAGWAPDDGYGSYQVDERDVVLCVRRMCWLLEDNTKRAGG